jgi:hypothetical protein
MPGQQTIQFATAQLANQTYQYKNAKKKLHKTNVAI